MSDRHHSHSDPHAAPDESAPDESAPDKPESDGPAFGAQWWQQHYDTGTGTGADATGEATPYVIALGPSAGGTALEVGCGTGADAIWLAQQGWRVTAIDIAGTAIDRARVHAAERAPAVAEQITWITGDVLDDQFADGPSTPKYDLVLSQYVHPAGTYEQFVTRLASLVADSGTLLVVGHDHADAHSSEHAPRDPSLAVDVATRVLGTDRWSVEIDETRERRLVRAGGDLVLTDTVVRARRL